jgi:small-conductance mechanosensitive channel
MSALPPPPSGDRLDAPQYQSWSPAYAGTRDHPQGTTIFVLGLLGILLCQLLGPFAWAMGSRARSEMKASGAVYSNGGLITAGWIMGIVSTCLFAVTVVMVVAVIGIGVSSA